MIRRLGISPWILWLGAVAACAGAPWHDTFYQYRIPVSLEVEEAGWHVLPLDEQAVTEAVNALESMAFSADYFAYNYVRLVEVDDEGRPLEAHEEAGFHLIPDGPRMDIRVVEDAESGRRGALFEGAAGVPPDAAAGTTVNIPVEPFRYYLLRYMSEDGGSSPALNYEPIHMPGSPLRRHQYRISYESRLLPQAKTAQRTLLVPDDEALVLRFDPRFITRASEVSVEPVAIEWLAYFATPGTKRCYLYYQPMGSHYLMVPEKEMPERPTARARVVRKDPAQQYLGDTRYSLLENDWFTAWYAAGTVKLTPSASAPVPRRETIRVTAARNEQESFQVVLKPKTFFRVERVEARDLRRGDRVLPASAVDVRAMEYVPILRSSPISPVTYQGLLADPLVLVADTVADPRLGNRGFWITVAVDGETEAGSYRGELIVTTDRAGSFALPLEVVVYDFALPEFSPFQSNLGGRNLHKRARSLHVNADYHGVNGAQELRALGNAYFEVMARNKFTPGNVAQFAPFRFRWRPPPRGYGVEAPDNYFELYDWDFTAFNESLDYYINELKVNQITLYHTNPRACDQFVYLYQEDTPLADLADDAPFLLWEWQMTHAIQYLAVGLDEKHPWWGFKNALNITQAQFDRLMLDYLGAIAANLEEQGWLEYATLFIDESHDDRKFLHFLRNLKSDPLVARIPVGVCMQGQSYLYYREHADDADFAYPGLMDFFIPELNENYNRWEDYFWSDYRIPRERRRLMPYVVTTSRSAIDVPGLSNRIVGLDLFRRHAGGYAIWETFMWATNFGFYRDAAAGDYPRGLTPWLDPYGRHGNGALAFFYPPRRDGVSESFDPTITPSLRVMLYRDGIDDFEYAWLLEQLIEEAARQDLETSRAEALLRRVHDLFWDSVHWTQNDAWYLELRERMAEAIVDLKDRL